MTIQGGIRDGFDRAQCPQGFVVQSCNFDQRSCDNTQQGWDYCGADSRNHRDCNFTGVCVSRY